MLITRGKRNIYVELNEEISDDVKTLLSYVMFKTTFGQDKRYTRSRIKIKKAE